MRGGGWTRGGVSNKRCLLTIFILTEHMKIKVVIMCAHLEQM